MYKKGDLINKDENLLRRVYRKDKRYRDPKTGRPSSRAFAPRPKDDGKLSVDIESLTSFELAIIEPIKFALYRISAALIYELGLSCVYDPISNNGFKNMAHALVIGFQEGDESIPGILSRQSDVIEHP